MIHVAIGIVIDTKQKILLAQRRQHSDHGGLWEFPGGKVEDGETVYAALCREFEEEVGLNVLSAEPLIKVEHQYDHYKVLLDTWIIDRFSGVAKGVEGQVVQWVDIFELQTRPMPEANQIILSSFLVQAATSSKG